jgi:undecaprenyl-diphosphatase
VPAWAMTKVIEKNLESLWVISLSLLIGGIVMWIVDVVFTRPRVTHMEEMSLPQAIWIGACQILSAVFPGTSRSMSTIAAGQIAGLSRPAALEFSFFLSMPTMTVATLYDLYKTLKPSRDTVGEGGIAPLAVNGHEWVVLAIGFVVSFIVALAVVAWFMNWVRRRGFAPFAIYRIALGIVLLILLARHII